MTSVIGRIASRLFWPFMTAGRIIKQGKQTFFGYKTTYSHGGKAANSAASLRTKTSDGRRLATRKGKSVGGSPQTNLDNAARGKGPRQKINLGFVNHPDFPLLGVEDEEQQEKVETNENKIKAYKEKINDNIDKIEILRNTPSRSDVENKRIEHLEECNAKYQNSIDELDTECYFDTLLHNSNKDEISSRISSDRGEDELTGLSDWLKVVDSSGGPSDSFSVFTDMSEGSEGSESSGYSDNSSNPDF